jgi:hypothetical protein
MGDNIAAENPDKMLRLYGIRCPHMGLITLERRSNRAGSQHQMSFLRASFGARASPSIG